VDWFAQEALMGRNRLGRGNLLLSFNAAGARVCGTTRSELPDQMGNGQLWNRASLPHIARPTMGFPALGDLLIRLEMFLATLTRRPKRNRY
jgi:hypothetical protein